MAIAVRTANSSESFMFLKATPATWILRTNNVAIDVSNVSFSIRNLTSSYNPIGKIGLTTKIKNLPLLEVLILPLKPLTKIDHPILYILLALNYILLAGLIITYAQITVFDPVDTYIINPDLAQA